jgi:hypothetical protein
VNQATYVSMIVLGLLLAVYGAGLLLTGRNYSSRLGRGLTRGDTQRLQRAPAIYFQALGALVAAGGLALLSYGVLMGFRSSLSSAMATTLQILQALLEIAVIVCGFWLVRLASRYKLFRWNKP